MINRNYGRDIKPSFVPKFSDPDLIKGILDAEFWRLVFFRDKKVVWLLFKALVSLKLERFMAPLRAVFRYNHGRRTIGVMISLMSALMMIAFNTHYAVGYLTTFFPFMAPAVPFFMTGEEIKDATFLNIRSQFLMIFWMGYLVISSLHLGRLYKGLGNIEAPTKRGKSWLQTLIFRHFKLKETIVQRFIEPFLAGMIGYVLLSTGYDFTFGLFLMIASTCLFIQEIYEAVRQFTIS